MTSREVIRERQAAGRRRQRLVNGLTTQSPQLSFSDLEVKSDIPAILSSDSSGKTTNSLQKGHSSVRLPYKDY